MIGHYEIIEDDGDFTVIIRDEFGTAYGLDEVAAYTDAPDSEAVLFVP